MAYRDVTKAELIEIEDRLMTLSQNSRQIRAMMDQAGVDSVSIQIDSFYPYFERLLQTFNNNVAQAKTSIARQQRIKTGVARASKVIDEQRAKHAMEEAERLKAAEKQKKNSE